MVSGAGIAVTTRTPSHRSAVKTANPAATATNDRLDNEPPWLLGRMAS